MDITFKDTNTPGDVLMNKSGIHCFGKCITSFNSMLIFDEPPEIECPFCHTIETVSLNTCTDYICKGCSAIVMVDIPKYLYG